MYIRLILSFNTQCQSVITIAASSYFTYTTTSLNNVFPCMMSQIDTIYGFTHNWATSFTLSLSIAKSYSSGTYAHPVQSWYRFYARVCEMYEEMYLSAIPSKQILYNNILSFQTISVPSSGSVSQILTNGFSRPRYSLICP